MWFRTWFLAIILASTPLLANEERPKVGLALSGGGARGAAHIGVLKVLEKHNIPIDYIAGTSMGAVIGGLYASGLNAEQIEQIYTSTDWDAVFEDKPRREFFSFRRKRDDDLFLIDAKPGIEDGEIKLPTGLIQGQKFSLILRKHTQHVAQVRDFDQLPIPFRALAADIATGKEVILRHGDLARAIRASMSVPALFAATEIEGQLLVDGGIANNLPVDVVRAMGADLVIAVDISTPLKSSDDVKDVLSITEQLTTILTRNNTEQQLATLNSQDLLIIPSLEDISSANFKDGLKAVKRGQAAAIEKIPGFAQRQLPPETQIDTNRTSSVKPNAPITVAFIDIETDSIIAEDTIRSRLGITPGERLDSDAINQHLAKLYGMGLFESVDYSVAERDGETGLVILAKRKSWGPDYLQFGIALDSTAGGQNSYNFSLGHLKTELNRLGGELRSSLQIGEAPELSIELYQPLSTGIPYYVLAGARMGRENVNIFQNGRKEAELRVQNRTLNLALGRELGSWGDLQIGMKRTWGKVKLITGTTNLPTESFSDGAVYLSFSADTLDDLNFPREGRLISITGTSFREDLGSDSDYDQFTALWNDVVSFDDDTLLFGAEFGTTLSGSSPAQSRFELGGFFSLSGFAVDQLSGQHYLILRGAYMHRFGVLEIMPIYTGITLEAANAWEEEDQISADDLITGSSLFVGLDTPIGPIYAGLGFNDEGEESIFFYLGRTF